MIDSKVERIRKLRYVSTESGAQASLPHNLGSPPPRLASALRAPINITHLYGPAHTSDKNNIEEPSMP